MNRVRRQLIIGVTVGMGLPALLAIASLWLHWLWRPELPSPVAVHWSGSDPDLFAELWVMAAAVLCFGFLVPVLTTALTLPSIAAQRSSTLMVRLLPGISLGTSLLVVGTHTGSLAIQRGLQNAHEAPGVAGVLLVSLLVAVVVPLGTVFLIPESPPRQPMRQENGSLQLGEDERVMWTRRIRMTGGILWVLYLSVATILISAVVTAPESPWWINLIMALATAAVLLGALTCTRFALRIDADGLALRSAPLGWPSTRVPLHEITQVSSGELSAVSEFGGWGLRMAPGARGVILQDGPALRVDRRDKPALVVTVDDAAEAADVLASLVQQKPVE